MRVIGCFLALFLSFAVQAQTFRVSDIRVEGLQRVSAGTVFSAMPIRVGDVLNQADIQNATRELFKIGYTVNIIEDHVTEIITSQVFNPGKLLDLWEKAGYLLIWGEIDY